MRASPLSNHPFGGRAIIKSRLLRRGAPQKAGGGWRRRGEQQAPCVKGLFAPAGAGGTDSHASDAGHWLGMTEGANRRGCRAPSE